MNWFVELIQSPVAIRLGEVLAHFLWQGAIVAGLLWLALARLSEVRPQVRYRAACLALIAMTLAPLVTFAWPGELGMQVGHNGAEFQTAATTDASVQAGGGSMRLNWFSLMAAGWTLGVAVLGMRLAGGWYTAHRLLVKGVRPVSVAWERPWAELRSKFGITRRVAFLESTTLGSPMALGWLRPAILIPAGLLAGMAPAQVEAIVAHELAHIARNDYLVNLFQRCVETLLFYHPAVWWVSDRIRIERELCCDDLAVAVQADRAALAGALIALAEQGAEMPPFTLAAEGGSLSARVRRLLDAPPAGSRGPRLGKAAAGGLILILAFGAGLSIWPRAFDPKLYQATARVRLTLGLEGKWASPATEIEIIRTGEIARDAVNDLHLAEVWGSTNHPLAQAEARVRFRERLSVNQFRNTEIVEITAADERPQLAAKIANYVANAYRYRANEAGQSARGRVDRLTEQIDRKQMDLKLAMADFESLALKYRGSAQPSALAEMGIAQHRVEMGKRILETLEMEKFKDETAIFTARPAVELIDDAIVPNRPERWRVSPR